jgi:hypothetical protein
LASWYRNPRPHQLEPVDRRPERLRRLVDLIRECVVEDDDDAP